MAFKPTALVFVADHRPGGVQGVGRAEHRLHGFRVGVPLVDRGDVDGRELPAFERVDLALLEAAELLLLRDRKPEFDEDDPPTERGFAQRSSLRSKNRFVSSGEQNPITGSTTARLYQERSKKHISPGFGSCAT